MLSSSIVEATADGVEGVEDGVLALATRMRPANDERKPAG